MCNVQACVTRWIGTDAGVLPPPRDPNASLLPLYGLGGRGKVVAENEAWADPED